MEILFFDEPSFNPKENLQREETLKSKVNAQHFFVRFWVNDPCVVMGRFQKEIYEVNDLFLNEKNIPLLRRTTGGGTVYHDRGTLNISFFKSKNPTLLLRTKDSITVTKIILNSLLNLGIDAIQTDRNALFVGEKKILGSAVSLTEKTFHYHASLLFKTNLEDLKNAINWNPSYEEGNYVKSVRSPVTNISSLNPNITLDSLKKELQSNFLKLNL